MMDTFCSQNKFIQLVNKVNFYNITKLEQNSKLESISTNTQSDNHTETDTSLVDIQRQLILQEDGKCTNAFNLISDVRILKAAYFKLKSKPGMMTEGSDGETLDGITQE